METLKFWWLLWSEKTSEVLIYTLAVAVVVMVVFYFLAWGWLTRKAKEYEAEAEERLWKAKQEAQKIREEADKYFRKKRQEIAEYLRKERLNIQALHEDKIGKWRKYIGDLEKKIRTERERKEQIREEVRKALGAIKQNPNLRYIEQRLKKALSV